jgi:hypothetical protein
MNKATMFSLEKALRLLAVSVLLLSLLNTMPAQAEDFFTGESHAAVPETAVEGHGDDARHAIQSKTASTGLTLDGLVTASLTGGALRLTVEAIINSRSSGFSGNLRVELWATQSLPVFGNTITHYTLGGFGLNPLPAGYEYPNVDATVSYTPPPDGCYYLTVALLELQSGTYYYEDLRTLTTGGVPDGAGYARFPFGSGQCQVVGCQEDATSACLLGGRFRAKVRYRNVFDNGPANADAFRKPVTGFANPNFETSFFYFNSADNVEVMLKMLDQGNTDGQGHPTIAVLFGSATPLRVELTITDTRTGISKNYFSSFTSMQGATDFTAFIK